MQVTQLQPAGEPCPAFARELLSLVPGQTRPVYVSENHDTGVLIVIKGWDAEYNEEKKQWKSGFPYVFLGKDNVWSIDYTTKPFDSMEDAIAMIMHLWSQVAHPYGPIYHGRIDLARLVLEWQYGFPIEEVYTKDTPCQTSKSFKSHAARRNPVVVAWNSMVRWIFSWIKGS